MEKPDNCSVCGCDALSERRIDVIADMVASYDSKGRSANNMFPTRTTRLSVTAWCCSECENAELVREDLEQQLAEFTQKTLNQAIAERN